MQQMMHDQRPGAGKRGIPDGVSRKTGYKWLVRYGADGVAGLLDRSRAPLSHPQAVPGAIAEACLAVRRAHPSWGPVKVRAFLSRREPAVA